MTTDAETVVVETQVMEADLRSVWSAQEAGISGGERETVAVEESLIDSAGSEMSWSEAAAVKEGAFSEEMIGVTAAQPPVVDEGGALETSSDVALKEEASLCPVCETPLLPDAIFCAECGHRVSGT
jgi:hypothetical protein